MWGRLDISKHQNIRGGPEKNVGKQIGKAFDIKPECLLDFSSGDLPIYIGRSPLLKSNRHSGLMSNAFPICLPTFFSGPPRIFWCLDISNLPHIIFHPENLFI